MPRRTFDSVIVGAGIIGLTVASEIAKRNPKVTLATLKKS